MIVKSKKKVIKEKKNSLFFKFSIILVLLVTLDQVTKFFLTNVNIDVGFFALNYVENTGISFGLFKGSTVVISIISFVVLGLIYLYKKEFIGKELPLIFIISGIIGNLIDRLLLGYVRDFFDLKWFPIFNIADSLLFLGVFAIIIISLKEHFSKKK